MGKCKHRAKQLVDQAMQEAKSEKLSVVADVIEKYMRSRMAKRGEKRESRVWAELTKLGIETTGDIQKLVNEIIDEQKPKEIKRDKPIKKTFVTSKPKGQLLASLGGGQACGTWGEVCSAGKYVGKGEC